MNINSSNDIVNNNIMSDKYYLFKKNTIINKIINEQNVYESTIIKYNITIKDFSHCDKVIIDKINNKYFNTSNSNYIDEYDDICNIFDTLEKNNNLSKASVNTYKKRFKFMFQLFNKSFLTDPNNVINILYTKLNIGINDYLASILSLIKYSEKYKNIIGNDNIIIYKNKFDNVAKQIREKHITNTEKTLNITWQTLKNIVETYKNKDEYIMEYLLLCMYTYIPPMRDNFGKILLINSCDYDNNIKNDYYILDEGRLIINNYKTGIKRQNDKIIYKEINIILPLFLQNLITYSLKILNRQYLITKKNCSLYNNGKLSIYISDTFNFSINDIRHAFETELNVKRCKFTISELHFICYITGHSFEMSLLYVRQYFENVDEKYLQNIIENKQLQQSENIVENISNKIITYF